MSSSPGVSRRTAAIAGRADAAWLAVDLGAESGRAIVGRFDGARVALEEVHRFPNVPVALPDGLYWDTLALYRETLTGIAAGQAATGGALASVGIDGWAVDFGLLGRDGRLLGNPLHYRDARFGPMVAELRRRIAPDELYRRTGIQTLPINTSCQLLAAAGSPTLAAADRLLLLPDLLRFWLTGEATAEATNASTSQLLLCDESRWDMSVVAALGVDPAILPPVVAPATPAGVLRSVVADDVGAALPVVAVGSHDTASAVAAVPATAPGFGYISSGTWSLVGVERPAATVDGAAREANLTNERGLSGTFRLLKNVMGLWLLQQCRAVWRRADPESSFERLLDEAAVAPAFGPLIPPDDPALLAPGDMPGRIAALCRASGQAVPDDRGAMTRCILESLACAYRAAFDAIEAATGEPITVVHVVGGGARNRLLCQLTADATGLPVIAGPVEATAIGNVMAQAMAAGRVGSLAEVRAVVARSFALDRYEPSADPTVRRRWAEHLARYAALPGCVAHPTPDPLPDPERSPA